jgi:hypothetical protein
LVEGHARILQRIAVWTEDFYLFHARQLSQVTSLSNHHSSRNWVLPDGRSFGSVKAAAFLRSHLSTLRNGNILHWLSFWICDRPRVLNLRDDVHALNNVTEDDVLAV